MTSLSLARSGFTIASREGEPIMQTLFRAGFALRVGCQRGGCGICRVQIDSGSVCYSVVVSEQALSADDRSRGVALACRAVPETDVTITVPTGGKLQHIAPMLTKLAMRQSA